MSNDDSNVELEENKIVNLNYDHGKIISNFRENNNNIGCSAIITGYDGTKGYKLCNGSETNPPLLSEVLSELSKVPERKEIPLYSTYTYINLRKIKSGKKCLTNIQGFDIENNEAALKNYINQAKNKLSDLRVFASMDASFQNEDNTVLDPECMITMGGGNVEADNILNKNIYPQAETSETVEVNCYLPDLGDFTFEKCKYDENNQTIDNGQPIFNCRTYMYDENNTLVYTDKEGACENQSSTEPFTNLKSSKKSKQRKSEEHFEFNKNLKCKHRY
jgi:hypothetical protein